MQPHLDKEQFDAWMATQYRSPAAAVEPKGFVLTQQMILPLIVAGVGFLLVFKDDVIRSDAQQSVSNVQLQGQVNQLSDSVSRLEKTVDRLIQGPLAAPRFTENDAENKLAPIISRLTIAEGKLSAREPFMDSVKAFMAEQVARNNLLESHTLEMVDRRLKNLEEKEN